MPTRPSRRGRTAIRASTDPVSEPTDSMYDPFTAEDDVRPPDEVVRETLIPSTVFANDLFPYPSENDIMEESWREYEAKQMELETAFFEQEKLERSRHFEQTKIQLERLRKVDPATTAYAMWLDYIALYEEGFASHVELEAREYRPLCKIVQRIRIPDMERTRLLHLVVCSDADASD